MFHEQTGYDFGNSRRSQEDARSPDAAVRVPAIAHLKKIAHQLTPSLSEKDGILRSLQKDGLDGGDHSILGSQFELQQNRLHSPIHLSLVPHNDNSNAERRKGHFLENNSSKESSNILFWYSFLITQLVYGRWREDEKNNPQLRRLLWPSKSWNGDIFLKDLKNFYRSLRVILPFLLFFLVLMWRTECKVYN